MKMLIWGVVKHGWAIVSEHKTKEEALIALETLQENSQPWIARTFSVESFDDRSERKDD
jgi:hypothetical protein